MRVNGWLITSHGEARWHRLRLSVVTEEDCRVLKDSGALMRWLGLTVLVGVLPHWD